MVFFYEYKIIFKINSSDKSTSTEKLLNAIQLWWIKFPVQTFHGISFLTFIFFLQLNEFFDSQQYLTTTTRLHSLQPRLAKLFHLKYHSRKLILFGANYLFFVLRRLKTSLLVLASVCLCKNIYNNEKFQKNG